MLQTISLSDVDLHIYNVGQGVPLLFVHGFPLDHSMWSAQLETFSQSHRVIAPDLRGFGQSEVTAGTVTMEQFADDLVSILDHLQITEPVTLCGLSMGGYVAWQFWKRHPSRLAKLILCDTRAIPDSPEVKQNRAQSAERVLNQGPEFLATSMPEKLYAPRTHTEQPELIAAAQKSIRNNAPAGIAAALLGMAARPDVTDWLPEITVPTLVLVGEEDAISNVDEMRGIAEAIPDSRFVVVQQAGHMSPQEQPEIVNRAIQEFLN